MGPNVTASPGAVLDRAPVDAVIMGEPEEAVRLIADGVALADVPNLTIPGPDGPEGTERRLPPGWMTQTIQE